MTLSKTILKVLAMGAILSSVIPVASSQTAPAGKPAKKPTVTTSSAKSGAKAKPGTKTKDGGAAAPAAASAPATEAVVSKRDPFMPLINDKKESGGAPEHLPPGKAGLVVATVRVDGTIKSPGGMLAMVSNPEQHVYFIHEGDQLYDGDVEKIAIDGVTFRENSKDAFGKPVERLITKRLYPSAGEQQ